MVRLTNVSQLLEEAHGGREADPCKTSVALVLYLQIKHVENQQSTFSLTQSRQKEKDPGEGAEYQDPIFTTFSNN